MILEAYYDEVRQALAERIAYIGVGVGTAPAAPDDNTLTDPYLREIIGCSLPSDNKRLLLVQWKLLRNEAIGMSITELGLYTSDNTLIIRKVRPPIAKTSDMEIGDIWEIEV